MGIPTQRIFADDVAQFLNLRFNGNNHEINSACQFNNPENYSVTFVVPKFVPAEPIKNLPETLLAIVPIGTSEYFNCNCIESDSAKFDFARLIEAFAVKRQAPIKREIEGVSIGENVWIGRTCSIGAGTIIHSNVVIEDHVKIGRNCIIKSGSVLGQDGFGIVKDRDGNNYRLPHLGGVEIGNSVEIGAICTVCAGTLSPTKVRDFVKTDDHVHIAHNCDVGENSILTACTELSGSVTIGKNVWIGPNSSIINGITIGDSAFIGIGSCVTKSCKSGVLYAGNPARELEK